MDSDDTTPRTDPVDELAAPDAVGGRPGRLGDYTLIRELARGGMGIVYEAEHQSLKNRVALKVMHPRFRADRAYSRRFQTEARSAAKLHHTNIVPVFDYGQQGDVCYYAMQYIAGVGLEQVLEDVRRLRAAPAGTTDADGRDALAPDDAPETIDATASVSAVSHGLWTGRLPIASTDFVTADFVTGVPGSSPRAADESSSSSSLVGQSESVYFRAVARIGAQVADALDYAHRQGVVHRDIKPSNLLLDAPGNVWVTDFGLAKLVEADDLSHSRDLVGTLRFMAPERLRGVTDRRGDIYALGATLYELLTLQPAFDEHDQARLIDQIAHEPPLPLRRRDRRIPRDLETLVLKALAKDPKDRFATAGDLRDELRRFLESRPILARPVGLLGRLGRWYKRNPRLAAATILAATLSTTLAIGSTIAALTFQNQRDQVRKANSALKTANVETKHALAQTLEAKAATDAALAESELSRQKAEAVGKFLVAAFRKPDADQNGKDVKVVDVLDEAARSLDTEFSGPSVIKGALLDAMGKTYGGLGEFGKAEQAHAKAIAVRTSALGADHPDTLTSRNNLADTYHASGRIAKAIELCEATLRRRQSTLGPDHPDTLTSRNSLALAYFAAGDTPKAIELDELTLKLREAKLGLDHLDVLASRNNLARDYAQAGRLLQATAMLETNLEQCESKLGPDHTGTLSVRGNLELAYQQIGRWADAIAMNKVTLARYESKLGPEHIDTVENRNNLALAYERTGRWSEAIAIHEPNLKHSVSKLGPRHPLTLTIRNNLALAYFQADRVPEAIELDELTLRLRESTLAPGHPDLLASRNNLARDYGKIGRWPEAIAIFEPTATLCESTLGPDHPGTFSIRNNLAGAYEALNRWVEAEALRRVTLDRRRRTDRPSTASLVADLTGLGANLMEQARWSDAEPIVREGLALCEKAIPDDWRRFDLMSRLGEILLELRRYSEAESQALAGYQGIKAREPGLSAAAKSALFSASRRLVRVYESWGKPEQADAWKRKLGLTDLPTDLFAPISQDQQMGSGLAVPGLSSN